MAGLDEVGRGAWAGPVSVGVALTPVGVPCPEGLRDSKQVPEEDRETMFPLVADWCLDWSVGHAAPDECDRWGMTIALRVAAHRAMAGLSVMPDVLLLDGIFDYVTKPSDAHRPREGEQPDDADGPGDGQQSSDPDWPNRAGRSNEAWGPADGWQPIGGVQSIGGVRSIGGVQSIGGEQPKDGEWSSDGEQPRDGEQPIDAGRPIDADRPSEAELRAIEAELLSLPPVKTVLRGDGSCTAIAAASILAKVTRDRMMRELSESFPAFDFHRNKGYPTPVHMTALAGCGLTSIHRRSWAFVDTMPFR